MSEPTAAHTRRMRGDRPLWLAVAGIASLIALVSWTLGHLKYPLARFLKEGGDRSGLPRLVMEHLGTIDFMLIAAVAGFAGALIYVEIRNAAFSSALVRAPRLPFTILLAALLAWFAHSYLSPGILLGGDTMYHVARLHHFRLGLEQGFLLFWDNYFNLGVPELQFTGPLLFWSGGVLDYLLGDPYLATKLLLFALHVGAGWVMYRLLRTLGLPPFAALVGTICYVGTFAYLYLTLHRGVLPQAYTLLFLPAGFLLVERVARRTDHVSAWWSALAIVGGLIMINHPSNGMFVGLYMGLAITGSLIARRYSWRRLLPLATAGALSIAMMLFILVPVLAEQSWVTMTGTSQLLQFSPPAGSFWRRIAVWSNTSGGTGGNFDAYLGISTLLLAITGIWSAWLGQRDAGTDWKFFRMASVLLVLALFLTGPHIRTIMFVMFFVALLAGFGAHHVQSRLRPGHLPAALVAILFLDLGSTAIQPLARTDKGYFAAAAEYLMSRYPGERFIEAAFRGDQLEIPIWGGNMLVYPLQQLGITFSYSATLFQNYGTVIAKDAERDLVREGRLSKASREALAMLNFSRIITDNGRAMDTPDLVIESVRESVLGRVIAIPTASPVTFAPRLLLRPPDPDLDKPVLWPEEFQSPVKPRVERLRQFVHSVLEEMQYDSSTRSAAAIPVRQLPAHLPEETARGGTWRHHIANYQVELSRVTLRLDSDRPGYVQLAHTWYPSQRVTHNGEAVQPVQGTLNLLVLPVHAGLNEYEILPVRTTLRRVLGLVSALVFVLLAGVGIRGALRR